MRARVRDQSEVEGQIVYRGYLHGQQLLGFEQVVQIGLRVDAVNVAAFGVYGREVVLPLLVAHVHRTLVGEEHGVAPIAGRHHAVEHVDTTLNGFQDVLGRTHTHQVARTVLGQDVVDHLNHLVHHLRRLANSQSANAGAASVVQLAQHVTDMLGSVLSEVFIGAALYDGKQCLVVAIQRFRLVEALHATLQPALGQPERVLGILVVALSWWTLVKGHHDIGTNDALCVHHVFWREDMLRTIDMAAKLTTLFLQLADARQREHLETTRVRQDGAVPRVELVQSASLAQDIESWAQIQVVGVAQNDLCLHLLAELSEVYTLHTAHRTHRHEDGRLDGSVVCLYQS